jgi:hypothetical protein
MPKLVKMVMHYKNKFMWVKIEVDLSSVLAQSSNLMTVQLKTIEVLKLDMEIRIHWIDPEGNILLSHMSTHFWMMKRF